MCVECVGALFVCVYQRQVDRWTDHQSLHCVHTEYCKTYITVTVTPSIIINKRFLKQFMNLKLGRCESSFVFIITSSLHSTLFGGGERPHTHTHIKLSRTFNETKLIVTVKTKLRCRKLLLVYGYFLTGACLNCVFYWLTDSSDCDRFGLFALSQSHTVTYRLCHRQVLTYTTDNCYTIK